MRPFNVMNSKVVGLPSKTKKELAYHKQVYPSVEPVQLKSSNEDTIKRAVLHLTVMKGLRAAHIFTYEENETIHEMYEPSHSPINQHELRGAMVYAIHCVRNYWNSHLLKIKPTDKGLAFDTQEVADHLQRIPKDKKIFVVLVFSNYFFCCGDYYDDTPLTQSMVKTKKRKSKKRMVDKLGKTTLNDLVIM